jgi:NAD(P)H-hydrate epimerase
MYETDDMKVAVNPHIELPTRKADGHKGDMGDVLFVAGAASYFGAPYFAALSFLKAGGGYSRLAAPKSITGVIAAKGSEIVFVPQAETRTGGIAPGNISTLLALADKVDMVVLGPGLGLEKETQELVRALVQQINKPLLVDGDGITALCKDLHLIKNRTGETILTPHMGEMSRLVNMTVAAIKHRPVDILQRTAEDLNAVMVLKGAHSLIGMPDQQVYVNMSGNSGMATAGSGDVLTGTIAAMFGAGLSLGDAVRKGVFVHGLAGDLAAHDKGADGITAQDIMDYLPGALKVDRDGLNATYGRRYGGPEVI